MAAKYKYEFFKDAHGEFRFHLKAANGEIIASSEGYKSKAAAENGIKSVKTNALGATDDKTKPTVPTKPPQQEPTESYAEQTKRRRDTINKMAQEHEVKTARAKLAKEGADEVDY
jgi:hypothetical protein